MHEIVLLSTRSTPILGLNQYPVEFLPRREGFFFGVKSILA
jgi:hypothetical protein